MNHVDPCVAGNMRATGSNDLYHLHAIGQTETLKYSGQVQNAAILKVGNFLFS